jgi:hypothetical protein
MAPERRRGMVAALAGCGYRCAGIRYTAGGATAWRL